MEGVSPRESQVLELLGRRCTNREIADQLFISIRTVESHVSALLRKTGLENRRDLAAQAAAVQAGSSPRLPGPLERTLGSVLVGRDPELAAFRQAWRQARKGHSRTVLVAGEPGAGKTRLAAELAKEAFDEGALVLYGRADDEMSPAYRPFVEALGGFLHDCDPIGLPRALGRYAADLTRLRPEVADFMEEPATPLVADPVSERHRLFEAVASWLSAAADGMGAVLVVDDIQWADADTITLLRFLLDLHSPAPLLVIVTYRPTDVFPGHPIEALVADLARLVDAGEMVRLGPLTLPATQLLIAGTLGCEAQELTPALVESVQRRAGGNAYFVIELARRLAGKDRQHDADLDALGPTARVGDLVRARVGRLSLASARVLTLSSVLGSEIRMRILGSLAALDGETLLDTLEEAERSGLMVEVGAGSWAFSHDLVRESIYQDLSASRRADLHERAADALLALHPDDVESVAYHLARVPTRLVEAAGYWGQAGDRAATSRAPDHAASCYSSGLDLLDRAGRPVPQLACRMRIGLGMAQRDSTDARYRETLLDAATDAISRKDRQAAVEAVLANYRGSTTIVGDLDQEKLAVIDATLAIVEGQPSAERALLLAHRAAETTFQGGHVDRLALADESLAVARCLGDPVLSARVAVRCGFAAIAHGRFEELAAQMTEAIHVADTTDDEVLRIEARLWGAGALLAIDPGAARRTLDEAVALADHIGAPRLRWMTRCWSVTHLASAGNLNDADAANQYCFELGTSAGEPDAAEFFAGVAFGIARLRGTAADTADMIGVVAEQYPRFQAWRGAHLWTLCEAGRLDEARQVLKTIDRVAITEEPQPLLGPSYLAPAALALDDNELAGFVEEAVLPFADRWAHGHVVIWGPASWTLGLAAMALGNRQQARNRFHQAIQACNQQGLRAITALVKKDLDRLESGS